MTKTSELLAGLPTFWLQDENSNNYKFFNSLDETLEELSTNITGLSNSIFISTASSTYLDDLAKIFNIIREDAETDADLRIRIEAFWANYNRGGLVSNLVSVFAAILNIEESEVDVIENENPGVVRLIGNLGALGGDITIPTASVIRVKIDSVKAAGVYVQIIYSPLIEDTWSEAYDDSDYTGANFTTNGVATGTSGIVGDFYFYDGEGELI